MASVAQGTAVTEPTLPPPAPEAAAHSLRLAEVIADAIAAEGDWIPFSRFMELALYAPGLGYYAAGAQKFGEAGDYVTSPEISPLFGKCIALQAAQVLSAVGGDILELGPGAGVLAADVLDGLKETGKLPQRYFLLEVSPDLRERQKALLQKRHPADFSRFVWLDTLPQKFRGLVIANEVLDVVPCSIVHRVSANEIVERGVIVTEAGFAWEDQALPEGELLRRAAAVLPPGDYEYLTEINLAAEGLVRTIASMMEAGLAIFIDYGFAEGEFYHPQRSMGTMRCHYRHRFHGDPFFMPGLQDITAHVDFSAMARAAEHGGADVLGYTTQAYFLISCGLAVLVSAGDPTMTLSKLRGTSAVHRLIGPTEMGELFKVLILGKGMSGPILGLQSARHLPL